MTSLTHRLSSAFRSQLGDYFYYFYQISYYFSFTGTSEFTLSLGFETIYCTMWQLHQQVFFS